MLPTCSTCFSPDSPRTRRPLQPNHMPPRSDNAACIATANPPARLFSDGNGTRLETTTRRLTVPCSGGILPRPAQPHRRIDQADVRIGLREIAPGFAIVEGEILRQQAQRIAPQEQALEHLAR